MLLAVGGLAACGSDQADGALATSASAVQGECLHPGNAGGNKRLAVMTRNLYLGGDISLPLAATSLPDALASGAYVWLSVVATDFPQRARALAEEIAASQPDLVGLQEVSLWRTELPSDELGPTGLPTDGFAPDATVIAYDYLEILLDALAERGLNYTAVSRTPNTDLELPIPVSQDPLVLMDVRYTDYNVILARADAPALHTFNPQGGVFEARISTVIAGAIPVTVLRGWTAIDVDYRGEAFRLIDAHPEAFDDAVLGAQTGELVGLVQDSPLPVVLVGDLNFVPGSELYELLTSALVDAWVALGLGNGFTDGQLATLTNPTSLLAKRIDFVLYHGPFEPQWAELIGDEPLDPPLASLIALPAFGPFPALPAGTPMYWPSDHAGVIAELRLSKEKFLGLGCVDTEAVE
jgi:endonuclease/exonuclease/phosphatase family metal-dependent hydrolase